VTSEKSLKSAKTEAGEVVGGDLDANHPLWSRLAVSFERTGRRLQVSGLAVEFDK
jgi:hypothetical protein